LVALDPATLQVVKRVRVDGTPVAISWAPIGIHIAYIARVGHAYSLHLIDGDLTHDRVVARHVSPVKPDWRWDSLAVAYVTSAGGVRVLDMGSGRDSAYRAPAQCNTNAPDQLAFAPHGTMLAVAVGVDAWAVDTANRRRLCLPGIPSLGIPIGGGIAWVSRTDLVVTTYQFLQRVRILPHGSEVVTRVEVPGGIAAVAASPDHRSLAVALGGSAVRVVTIDVPTPTTATSWSREGPHTIAPRLLLLETTTPRPEPDQRVVLLWR
jgi:hypothetical protein